MEVGGIRRLMAQGVAGVLDPTGSWVVLVLSPRGIFSSQASSLSSAEDPAGEKGCKQEWSGAAPDR